jgi:hypothetical protein
VAVEPDGVTIETELWLAGMVVVVVPPYEVKTDEMTGDGETETVVVPPSEVSTVTDSGWYDGVETIDESEYETVETEPDGVMYCSVMTGDELAGVSTTVTPPDGV